MVARPTKWHVECLANWKRNVQRDVETLKEQEKRVARAVAELEHYQRQVAEALRLRKPSFDKDRFMTKDAPVDY